MVKNLLDQGKLRKSHSRAGDDECHICTENGEVDGLKICEGCEQKFCVNCGGLEEVCLCKGCVDDVIESFSKKLDNEYLLRISKFKLF